MYMTKYIIHIGICGFGNQLLGFKEACIIAKYTNRTIISPIFLPHGSIRNQCEEYYKFEDIFDYNLFKQSIQTATFDEIKNIPINNIYCVRHKNEWDLTSHYYNNSKQYYNINIKFEDKKQLVGTSFSDYSHIDEIKKLEDDIVVLVGTFNSIKLSTCYKNGCLNESCSLNLAFKNNYDKITNAIRFNNKMFNLADNYLQKMNLNPSQLCVFHMRVLDHCTGRDFSTCYNKYNEKNVYQSIVCYLYELNRMDMTKNIFLIAPPQYLTMKKLEIFNTNKIKKLNYSLVKEDKFILSIIELCICEKAQILITSPTNTPDENKLHARSSFTLHTKNLRDMNNHKFDICISKIYNSSIKFSKKYNIRPLSNKKIISYSLYNDKELYNYGVIVNYELKKYIYKDWIIRLYVDASINNKLLNYITNNLKNIEVFVVDSRIPPMFYRFFPLDDPNVEYFISRDLDSIISYREEAMVKQWIECGKCLHLIHEVSVSHRHKIMGGMFGFKNYKHSINKDLNILKEGDLFNYSPFGGLCRTGFEENNIVIRRIESPAQRLIIPKKFLTEFYQYKTIDCKWCGGGTAKCTMQRNGDLLINLPKLPKDYFFTRVINNGEVLHNSLKNIICEFYQNAKRTQFIYGDDQNCLNEVFKNCLNVDNCIDHNKCKDKWEYSLLFNSPYKSISSLISVANENYVGNRRDMKKFFDHYFKKYHINLKIG